MKKINSNYVWISIVSVALIMVLVYSIQLSSVQPPTGIRYIRTESTFLVKYDEFEDPKTGDIWRLYHSRTPYWSKQ